VIGSFRLTRNGSRRVSFCYREYVYVLMVLGWLSYSDRRGFGFLSLFLSRVFGVFSFTVLHDTLQCVTILRSTAAINEEYTLQDTTILLDTV
jgi:hypothetical protein